MRVIILLSLLYSFQTILAFHTPRCTCQNNRAQLIRIHDSSAPALAHHSNSDNALLLVSSNISTTDDGVSSAIEIDFFREKLERKLVDVGDLAEDSIHIGGTATFLPRTSIPGCVTIENETFRNHQRRNHRDDAYRYISWNNRISSLLSHPLFKCFLKKRLLLSVALLASFVQRGVNLLSSNKFAGVSAWYFLHLKNNPVITKALTSSVMCMIGDALAQKVQRQGLVAKEKGYNKRSRHCFRRSSALMCDGLFSGSCMHFAYDLFENIIPTVGRVGIMSSVAAMSHCVADTLFMDSFFIGTMFISSGLLEGLSFWNDIIPQLKRDYVPAVKAGVTSSTCLMPLEFFIFRFVPISFRPLAVNFLDIIWNGVVSFMLHKNRNNEGVDETNVI